MSAPVGTETGTITVDTRTGGENGSETSAEALVLESLQLIRKQKEELARLRTKRTQVRQCCMDGCNEVACVTLPQVVSPSNASEIGSHPVAPPYVFATIGPFRCMSRCCLRCFRIHRAESPFSAASVVASPVSPRIVGCQSDGVLMGLRFMTVCREVPVYQSHPPSFFPRVW
jgi:hypothetical protein